MKKINNILKTLLCFTILFIFYSCKKNTEQTEEKQEYTQYFNALIANKSIAIQNSHSKNRNLFRGSWTGVDMINGDQIEMYTVKTILPKEVLNMNAELNFQIFDIKKKIYFINEDDIYKKDFSTHIYLKKHEDLNNETIYTTRKVKKPFEIEITKYEFPNESLIPILGGNFNGVLYNVKDITDSITIKNGNFEVQY